VLFCEADLICLDFYIALGGKTLLYALVYYSDILSLSILQWREQAMEARFRSWWQHIKQRRVAIKVTTAMIVIPVALIVGYRFDVTGFNGYIQVSTVHTIGGPMAGTVTRTEVYQPGKTLWDWLQLLIIPVVLAIGGFWLNQLQKSREERTTEQRAKTEREAAAKRDQTERDIALDNQRETALQEYIDKLSELLLKEHLGELKPE